jgi:methyl-accepting chemotaxis protein
MDSATQTTAATAEESAAAAQELNAQAFALDRVVDQLGSLVKGRARPTPAARGPVEAAPATAPEVDRRVSRVASLHR